MSAAEIPNFDPEQDGARDLASVRITEADQVDLRDVPPARPMPSVIRTRRRNPIVHAAYSVGRWLGNTQREIRRNVRSAAARARTEARHVREERPMQALAIAAGAAFALGMIIRFWRSHSS